MVGTESYCICRWRHEDSHNVNQHDYNIECAYIHLNVGPWTCTFMNL